MKNRSLPTDPIPSPSVLRGEGQGEGALSRIGKRSPFALSGGLNLGNESVERRIFLKVPRLHLPPVTRRHDRARGRCLFKRLQCSSEGMERRRYMLGLLSGAAVRSG